MVGHQLCRQLNPHTAKRFFNKNTVQLKFSPTLTNLLEIQAGSEKCSLDNVLLKIKQDEILEDFLKWEKVSYSYTMTVISAKESDISALEELLMYKNGIELELQSSIKSLLENQKKGGIL